MKAVISTKRKDKPGGLVSLKNQIQSTPGIEGIVIKQRGKQLIIEGMGKLSPRELKSTLSHTKIDFTIQYEEEQTTKPGKKPTYPQNYGALKGQVKEQQGTIKSQKGKISTLEAEIRDERAGTQSKIRALVAKNRDLIARCESVDVQDFLSGVMSKENLLWKNFTQSYATTLNEVSEMYGISVRELEEACLDYVNLDEKLKSLGLTEDYEKAERARKHIEEQDLKDIVSLNPEAREILKKVGEIKEKDKAIKEAKDELEAHAKDKTIRIAITTEEQETLLTLPFKFRDLYEGMETYLIECIDQSIKDSKLDSTKEDFNTLLRYRIPGMKKRARGKLVKVISSCEDDFIRLGGQREIIGIETYST